MTHAEICSLISEVDFKEKELRRLFVLENMRDENTDSFKQGLFLKFLHA